MSAYYPLCQWCQSPNPPRSTSCSQCGAPILPPPSAPAAPFRPDRSFSSWAKLFLIITGTLVFWFFGMLGVRIFSPESFKPLRTVNFNATASRPAPAVGLVPAASPTPANGEPVKAIFTNAERLAVAKRFMNGGNLRDLENAEGHLNNIQQGTPEYKEAQRLLKKLAAQRAALLRDELKNGRKR